MTEVVLSGLRKAFDDGPPVVAGVDLAVSSGTLAALLGPSGCGKTTTLRMVAGLEAPDAGAVRFDGRDVTATPARRRNVGMVFQSYALFPHMTVAGNVGFGLAARGVARRAAAAKVDAMLDLVRLGHLRDRFPAQLSGGQRQRVALARTLATEPAVLMLDEPMANLDAALRVEMRGALRDLQRRVGVTTILVTHDQTEAFEMADAVAVMLDGRLAQTGPPEAIYRRPETPAVAAFLGAPNLFAGRMTAPDRVDTALGPLVASPRAGCEAGTRVRAMLRAEAFDVNGEAPAPNRLSGRVVARRFHGAQVRYDVACPGGTVAVVEPARRLLDEGTTVTLDIAPERVWLMPESPPRPSEDPP